MIGDRGVTVHGKKEVCSVSGGDRRRRILSKFRFLGKELTLWPSGLRRWCDKRVARVRAPAAAEKSWPSSSTQILNFKRNSTTYLGNIWFDLIHLMCKNMDLSEYYHPDKYRNTTFHLVVLGPP